MKIDFKTIIFLLVILGITITLTLCQSGSVWWIYIDVDDLSGDTDFLINYTNALIGEIENEKFECDIRFEFKLSCGFFAGMVAIGMKAICDFSSTLFP